MNALTSLVSLVLSSFLFSACTAAPKKDRLESDGGGKGGADTNTAADADTNTVADADTNTVADADTNTVADADTPINNDADAAKCELPESQHPSCEACLTEECSDEYSACHCDAECVVQLGTLRTCFGELHGFSNPSADPAADYETCMAEAGGESPSPLLPALLTCVGEAYVSPEVDFEEDPYNRTGGDSLCSAACFDLFSFEELQPR
jgi:hypothetical protein